MPIIYDPTLGKTYADVIEQILSNVRGFTAATDVVTSLSAAMTDTDTSGKADDASVLSKGIIEIGDELMWVNSIDSSSGNFQLLPKGRGWSGTTAATHALGDTVTIAPAYPRARVKQAINEAIQALWPTLFSVATYDFVNTNPAIAGYGIPADAEVILDVRVKGWSGNWDRVREWEVERSADLTDFPTGVMLRLPQLRQLGQSIRVVYGKRPAPLVNETDLFTSTGYDNQVSDLVVLAVMANIVPMLDVARLQVTHVSAEELQQARPLGSAVSIARDFRQQYQARLAQERASLNQRYPARVHLTR